MIFSELKNYTPTKQELEASEKVNKYYHLQDVYNTAECAFDGLELTDEQAELALEYYEQELDNDCEANWAYVCRDAIECAIKK